jgi:hypothetical protein
MREVSSGPVLLLWFLTLRSVLIDKELMRGKC